MVADLILVIWVSRWCNNTSIGKKHIDANYSALTKEIESIHRDLDLKLVIESELLNTEIFLAKATLKIGQKKYLLFVLCWKLIHGRIKLKI